MRRAVAAAGKPATLFQLDMLQGLGVKYGPVISHNEASGLISQKIADNFSLKPKTNQQNPMDGAQTVMGKPLADSANPLLEYRRKFETDPLHSRNRSGAAQSAKIRAQARARFSV
jgi:hypothetical protein